MVRQVINTIAGMWDAILLRIAHPAKGRLVEPIDLGKALLRTMESRRKVSISKVYVPNEYTILLHPNPAAAVRSLEHTLLEELKGVLLEKAERGSLSFIGPVQIVLATDDQLTPSEIHVEAAFREPDGGYWDESSDVPSLEGGTRIFRVLESDNHSGRLIVTHHNGTCAEHSLTRSLTKIGRGPQCSIQLSDPKASRLHATIRRHQQGYVIKDNNSTNGTFVNGSAISETVLAPDDVIQIGNSIIEFHPHG